jgi:hypothetical protein
MNIKIRIQRIKQVAFLVIFSLVAVAMNAQNNFPIEPPNHDSAMIRKDTSSLWHGLYINPTAEIGGATPVSGTGIKGGLSFDLGAEACYMFSHSLGVSLGLQYEQYQFKYKYSNVEYQGYFPIDRGSYPTRANDYDSTIVAGYTTDATYTFGLLRIPLLLRLFSTGANNVGWFGETGVIADVLVKAGVTGSASEVEYTYEQSAGAPFFQYNNTTTNNANITGVTPDAAKFNMAAHLALGVFVPLGDRADLAFALSYDYHFLNGGTGNNDIVRFSDATYYFYGNGSNYGGLNSASLEVKCIFKLSK